jgi:membrane protease YdiL (CAAX protease family)
MKKYRIVIAIFIFYTIAISLRYLTFKTSILSGVDNFFIQSIFQGIGPTIGALIACAIFRIKIEMSFSGCYKNFFIPFTIYWIFPILLIGIIAYFTNGTVPFVAIFLILIGLLEEVGWRGFLQQLLRPLPKFAGILIITILWFVWHLNFELSGSNFLFFVILFLGSWGIGLVADKTNSFLAVAAFHSLISFPREYDTKEIIILTVLITFWVLSIIFRGKLASKKAVIANDL